MKDRKAAIFKAIIAVLSVILCGMLALCVFLAISGRKPGDSHQAGTDSGENQEVNQGDPGEENKSSGEVQKRKPESEESKESGKNKQVSPETEKKENEETKKAEQDSQEAKKKEGEEAKKAKQDSQEAKKKESEEAKKAEQDSQEAKKKESEEAKKAEQDSQEAKKKESEEDRKAGQESNKTEKVENKKVYLGNKETVPADPDQTYSTVIDGLENEYGPLTLKIHDEPLDQYANGAEYMVETYGLCYLSLIDFDNDGTKELLAVAKHENDSDYTVMVYAEKDGHAEQVASTTKLTDAARDGNYLCLLKDGNQNTYLDRTQWGGEWLYDEIYGYNNGSFELISISFQESNFNEGRMDYFIVEEVPETVSHDKLNKRLVSEEEYKEKAPLAAGRSDVERTLICFKYPQDDSEIASGDYTELDVDALQNSIDQVKMEVSGSGQSGNGSTGSTRNEPVEDKNEAWKQAYIDFIESDPDIDLADDMCTCGLIYLDNDDIPELIIEYSNEAAGTRIVSFKNGNTIDHQFVRTGGIQYIEREGFIYNSVGAMGSLIDEFVLLDDDGFHDYGHGFRYGESQDLIHFTQFNWNDVDISEDEYMANISEFDNTRSISWNSYSEGLQSNNYSPDGMCSYLMGY